MHLSQSKITILLSAIRNIKCSIQPLNKLLIKVNTVNYMYILVPPHLLNRYGLRQYRQRWRLTPKPRKSGQRYWT